jgi:hypothetical protein
VINLSYYMPGGLKRRTGIVKAGVAFLLLGVLSACETVPTRDYSAFVEYMPRSILVLPPTNNSVEVNAPYSYVTTVSQPLAEKGYYVFPVALVDVMMKENGLPLPEEMHSVPLNKLGEVFGADAVMYINLIDFGQKYQVLSSVTKVDAEAKLVDIETGSELWSDSVNISLNNSSTSQGGLLGAVIEATITQAVADVRDDTHPAARMANKQLVRSMLDGPLHPEFNPEAVAPPKPKSAW